MEKESKKYPLRKEKTNHKIDCEYLPSADEDYDEEVISSLDTFPTKAALGLYLRHVKYEDI